MEGITVWAITVICFLIAEGVKATPLDNKWLPLICGATGGALGVVAMYVVADFPANDILNAIAIGIVSGFAATGVHQTGHQLSGNHEDDEDPDEIEIE